MEKKSRKQGGGLATIEAGVKNVSSRLNHT